MSRTVADLQPGESGIVEKQATTEQKDDLRTIASELETISK